MTQNKKKGIAKKALSISLVAAMLATSNVPVWASGFEAVDPEVEVQEFAPEVVEEAGENGTDLVQAASDYKVESNVELTTDHEGDWSGKLTLVQTEASVAAGEKATLSVSKDDTECGITSIELYDADDMIGSVSGKNLKGLDAVNAELVNLLTPAKENYNKTYTIKLYVEKDVVAEYSCTLGAVDITKETITTSDVTGTYTGSVQGPENVRVTVNGQTAEQEKGDISISYKNAADGVNVGTYTYVVQGVEANGFTGVTTATKTYKITPVAVGKNVIVTVSGDKDYTGSAVLPGEVVVIDKLSGQTIPSDLYTVTATANKNPGVYTSEENGENKLGVAITMKTSYKDAEGNTISNNFSGKVDDSVIEGAYTINKLDLSTLPQKYDISLDTQVGTPSVTWNSLTFVDKATGKEVAASTVLLSKAVTVTVDEDAKTVTFAPAASYAKYVEGELVISYDTALKVVTAADVKVKDAEINGSKKNGTLQDLETDIVADLTVEYDGTAQEPLKEVFSSLYKTDGTTYKLGSDYEIVYTNNTVSNVVAEENKADTAKVALRFMGEYTGTIEYDIKIEQAEVTVTPDELVYEAGKTSYEASAVLTYGDKKTVPAAAYTTTVNKTAEKVNEEAVSAIEIKDKNYKLATTQGTGVARVDDYNATVTVAVTGKSLNNNGVTAAVEGTYVYTGDVINPTVVVKDGNVVLKEGTDYAIVSKAGTDAGEASVTIEGKGDYSGRLTLKYTIAKANIKDAKILSSATEKEFAKVYDVPYTGAAQGPDVKTVKMGSTTLKESADNGKTGDYIIEFSKDNKNIGSYTFTIKALPSSTKVEGTYEGTYKITAATESNISFAKRATPETLITDTDLGVSADYTGKAITLNDLKTKFVLVDKTTKAVLTEGKDYRLEYTDNTDAGIATVAAYGLGNYAVQDKKGVEVAAATGTFAIKGEVITADDITAIADAEYAGGLYVEPQVTVKVGKTTLVQGTDFEVTTTAIEVGSYRQTQVKVSGKGAYVMKNDENEAVSPIKAITWKVVAKDLKNCTVSLDSEGNVVVKNGEITVPSSEYTVTENEDGTFTVEASKTTKNYTGSVKVNNAAPEATTLKVTDRTTNTVTVGWDEVEGAEGYTIWFRSEYDDSVQRKIVNGGNVTEWTHKGLQAGTKYFYTVKAWVKTEDGYVFSEQSPVQRGTTKPMAAKIASVTANDGKVKVKLTGAVDGAEMYSMCYSEGGNKFNENDFKVGIRTSYTTRTMKDTLEPGTYWVAVKSYRDLGNNKRVYGAWSNAMKVVVK